MSALEDLLADLSVSAAVDRSAVPVDREAADKHDVLRALGMLREPSKAAVMQQAREVSWSLRDRATFGRFKFQERGSLWSHHIEHVSDVDVQLFGSEQRGVTRAEALELVRVCRDDLFLTFHVGQLRRLDAADDDDARPKLPLEALEAALARPGADHGAIVCTGVRRLAGGL
ncbi:hypothetical protein M885DRAFT_311669 [Pelagophyceae sp. CCMP2097]|nr:hypothetical protein M885DRAFT_311669 [Pelagophyceae sp. CCMP2097]